MRASAPISALLTAFVFASVGSADETNSTPSDNTTTSASGQNTRVEGWLSNTSVSVGAWLFITFSLSWQLCGPFGRTRVRYRSQNIKEE